MIKEIKNQHLEFNLNELTLKCVLFNTNEVLNIVIAKDDNVVREAFESGADNVSMELTYKTQAEAINAFNNISKVFAEVINENNKR